ncbi:uncharacterized protein VTP21DRAFT_7401 [Calcarisporiella thermophila]|uniref:uncharacterized protein n=1 Tax=Calcarisporiella thermophila TaxID=911321 RepID=UPI00374336B9
MFNLKAVFALIAVAQFAIAQAPAGQCPSITNPVDGTAWKLGDKAVINWTPGGNSPKVNINLRKGPASAMQQVATIASNVDQNAGTFTYNVPAGLTPGSDYAIEIGQAPNVCYSHYFTIDNNGAAASSGAASASGASGTAALPSASGASSGATSLPAASASGISSAATSASSASVSLPSAASSASALPSSAASATASNALRPSTSVQPKSSAATSQASFAFIAFVFALVCVF